METTVVYEYFDKHGKTCGRHSHNTSGSIHFEENVLEQFRKEVNYPKLVEGKRVHVLLHYGRKQRLIIDKELI